MPPINTIYPPDVWANESLDILQNNLVMARLVHRDFENEVSMKGKRVKTRRPTKLTSKVWAGQSRTTGLANDETEVELLSASEIDVLLDTLRYTSFLVEDVDAATSIKDLREEFIVPAIEPIAVDVDADIMAEFCGTGSTDIDGNPVTRYAYEGAGGGDVVGEGDPLDEDDIVTAREALNTTKCPEFGRQIVLSTKHEADLLRSDLFVQANTAGSDEALVNANLGRKFGFNFYMSQTVPTAADTNSTPQSLAFHRNALSLVTRPLLNPEEGEGVRSATREMDGIGIRVVSGYEQRYKGSVMSFDCLYGIQLIDAAYAAILNP